MKQGNNRDNNQDNKKKGLPLWLHRAASTPLDAKVAVGVALAACFAFGVTLAVNPGLLGGSFDAGAYLSDHNASTSIDYNTVEFYAEGQGGNSTEIDKSAEGDSNTMGEDSDTEQQPSDVNISVELQQDHPPLPALDQQQQQSIALARPDEQLENTEETPQPGIALDPESTQPTIEGNGGTGNDNNSDDNNGGDGGTEGDTPGSASPTPAGSPEPSARPQPTAGPGPVRTPTPTVNPLPTLLPTLLPTATAVPTPTPVPPVPIGPYTGVDGSLTLYRFMTLDEATMRQLLGRSTTLPAGASYTISWPAAWHKTLTKEDVGQSFILTVSMDGYSDRNITCEVAMDAVEYKGADVVYPNGTPKFYEGEPLNSVAGTKILDLAEITLQGYGGSSHVDVTVYPAETEKMKQTGDLEVEFATTNASKYATRADLLAKNEKAVKDRLSSALPYEVYSYKAVLLADCTTGEELKEIYTDAGLLQLTDYYGEMLKTVTNTDGYLTRLFRGWALTEDENAAPVTSYDFTVLGVPVRTFYPVWNNLDSTVYLVKLIDGQQVLVGYTGRDETLEVPQGVTRVALQRELTPNGAAVKTLLLSNTVTAIDFAVQREALPHLEKYGAAGDNPVFSADAQGLLLSADGQTLHRVAAYPIGGEIALDGEKVTVIADGALSDALAAGQLTLAVQGSTPPALTLKDAIRAEDGSPRLRVRMADSRGGPENLVADYLLKQYAAAWGQTLDVAALTPGYALQSVLFTPTEAEKNYKNIGNTVYSTDGKTLEYVPEDAATQSREYIVSAAVESIAPGAFEGAQAVGAVRLTDAVGELQPGCFARSGLPLAAVTVEGDNAISVGDKIFGVLTMEIVQRNGLHLMVSEEQQTASHWREKLTADYGAEIANAILLVGDSTIYTENGCVYLKDKDGLLTLIQTPAGLTSYTAPAGLVAIGANAFAACPGLKMLALPEVTALGEHALAGCGELEILALTADAPVTVAGDLSADCPVLRYALAYETDLQLPEGAIQEKDTACFAQDGLIYRTLSKDRYAVVLAPSDTAGVLSLKEGTVSVEERAFAGCTALTGLADWQMLTDTIGESAFDSCTALGGSLTLNAANLGTHAFRGVAITALTLDRGVTTMGDEVFADCQSLVNATWIGDTTEVGEATFVGCSSMLNLYIGEESLGYQNLDYPVTTIGNNTCENMNSLCTLTMYTSVVHLGDYAFRNCSELNLNLVSYGAYGAAVKKMESIGDYAFEGCVKLERSFINARNLKTFGEGAFKDCTKISTVTFPQGLEEIGDYCYAGCMGIRSISASSAALVRIGTAAFTGCTKLTSLSDLRENTTLTEIGDYAFAAYEVNGVEYAACSSLNNSIALPSSLERIGEGAFAGANSLVGVNVDVCTKLDQIGRGAFMGCTSLRKIDLSATALTELAPEMFYGCTALQEIQLPATLTRLDEAAFGGCDALGAVRLYNTDGIVEVDPTAFDIDEEDEARVLKEMLVYVPDSTDGALLEAYRADEAWLRVVSQQPEHIRSIAQDRQAIGGGIYQVTDGKYRLVEVMPALPGLFEFYIDTDSVAPDAFEGCGNLSMILVNRSLPTALPDALFEQCTGLEILILDNTGDAYHPDTTDPAIVGLEGSLFGEGHQLENPRFHVYVDEDLLESYAALPAWQKALGGAEAAKACLRSGGQGMYTNGNVLYGVFPSAETGERQMHLLQAPQSYQGSLAVISQTVQIDDYAFQGCTGLVSAEIHVDVANIGDYAFEGCTSLETVYIPNTTTTKLSRIGKYAFMNCTSLVGRGSASLVQLILPSSLQIVDVGAFKGCTSLTYFSTQSNPNYGGSYTEIADETFAGCTKLATFTGTATSLSLIERIGKDAFKDTAVTSLSWTNMTRLKEVDDGAYSGCPKLRYITFADRLERIGDNAFGSSENNEGGDIQFISFNGATPPELGENIFGDESEKPEEERIENTISLYVPLQASSDDIVKAYHDAWEESYPTLAGRIQGMNCKVFRMVSNILYAVNPANAKELTVVKIAPTLSTASIYNTASLYGIGIAADAATDCNLKTFTLTSNIKTIGDRAFKDSKKLATVTVSTKILESIGAEAFSGTAITALNLPDSVTKLGDRMLAELPDFDTLTLGSLIPMPLPDHLFGDTLPADAKIVVPEKSFDSYLNAWAVQLTAEYGDGAVKQLFGVDPPPVATPESATPETAEQTEPIEQAEPQPTRTPDPASPEAELQPQPEEPQPTPRPVAAATPETARTTDPTGNADSSPDKATDPEL